jgi:hypothetical protein
MPKLLVLFQSRQSDVVDLAEAAVEGARRVRFAEVDLRRLADANETSAPESTRAMGGREHRTLGHVDDLVAYDGLLFVVSAGADASDALTRTLGAIGAPLTNKVGSALTPATGTDRSAVLWSALTPMADHGMILVPAAFDDANESREAARRLGTRVAEVIGWVTHARSHHHQEQPRRDHHHHDHQHDHH